MVFGYLVQRFRLFAQRLFPLGISNVPLQSTSPIPLQRFLYQVFSFAANTPLDIKGGVAGAGLAPALLLPLLHLIACDKPINIKASWFSRPSPPPLVPLTLHVHYVDRTIIV